MFNFKNIMYFCLAIIIILSLKLLYSNILKKGYEQGYSDYDKIYQDKLIKDIETERSKIKKEYDLIISKIEKNRKIDKIHNERLSKIKEITSSENMKCEMTDEQVKKLNEFIKF